MVQSIEEQVARAATARAITCGNEHVTYGELNARANRLAHHLLELGIGLEGVVGVALHRSVDLVVACLALLKTGAVYLPLDPDYPAARITSMLEDARPSIVITSRDCARVIPDGKPVLVLNDPRTVELLGRAASHNVRLTDLASPLHARGAAHLFYTSGSTGVPNGVLVERRALEQALESHSPIFAFAPGHRHVSVTSPSFDPSLADILLPLSRGAEVVIVGRQDAYDIASVSGLIRRHGGTSIQATPQYFAWLTRERPDALRGLRVFVGGEALSWQIAANLRSTGEDVWNLYGPTESTIYATAHLVTREDVQPQSRPIVSIGRPLEKYLLFVLDAFLSPVPPGVTGEIYVAGDTLARGYLHRPALTASRFVANPHGLAGERIYRTGDLGRWDREHRRLEFVGRSDYQVKIRGFRVELGEIEAMLRRHEHVADAVVTMHGENEDARLTGYVLPAAGTARPNAAGSLSEGESSLETNLLAYLRQKLPDHMVPAAIGVLEDWPRTPNGKVNRRALPLIEPASAARKRSPVTACEEGLCALYQEVLGREWVGLDDDFFELGGHSLLAMRLLARIRDKYAVPISIQDLFERRTVASVAELIDNSPRMSVSRALEVTPIPRHGALPLSFNQERYLAYELFGSSTATAQMRFHIPVTVRLPGEVDADAVERALNEIIRRHEVLRTTFFSRIPAAPARLAVPLVAALLRIRLIQKAIRLSRLSGGSRPHGIYRQRIHANAPLILRHLDVSHLPQLQQLAAVRQLPEIRERIDWSKPPLMRAVLVKRRAREHALVVVVSHLVFDWWSELVLRREFAVLYDAFSSQRPSPLSDLAVQYVDWAAWERERFSGPFFDRCLEFWQAQLPDFSALKSPSSVAELPYHRRAAVATLNSKFHTISIEASVFAAVRRLCSTHRTTMSMFLLAALASLLCRASGKEGVTLWIHFANRTVPASQDLIGWFQQLLLVTLPIGAQMSFADALSLTRDALSGAMTHAMPLELLAWRNTFDIPKDTSSAVPHVFFDMRERTAERDDEDQLAESMRARLRTRGDQALLVTGVQHRGRLKIETRYSLDWFTPESAAELMQDLKALIERYALDPSVKLAYFPVRGGHQCA